jgi:hypothetical protein
MNAFYEPDGASFLPTVLTRGPWDLRFQHGGPPSALLAGQMVRAAPDFALARLAVELLRPVPIAPLQIQLDPGPPGRTVRRLTATLLHEGRPLLIARGLFILRQPRDLPPGPPLPPWPDPAALPLHVFTFFQHEEGYHQAIELRRVFGQWGQTPIGFWGRPRVPLIAGSALLPEEAVITLADAQSGMGPPLDPLRYSFVNPDLTVYLERPPVGDWVGFEVRSGAGPLGAGLSESLLRDEAGLLGRSAQSLVIAER